MGHSSLRIQLLDGFSVSLGRVTVPKESWRSGRARSLVKVLALSPGHKLHREQVIDLLWPDADPACALHNLRSALYAARAALEPGHPIGSSTYLPQVHDMLHLQSPAGLWVDVDAFRVAAADCRRRADVDGYRAALSLYTGDLLPEDRYEDWAAAHREALRETCLALTVELGHLHESRGEFAEGIAVLEGAVVLDGSHEDAHAGMMRLHALAGRPGQALRQYARLSETLARELGVAPMPSTAELREQIASGRFGTHAVAATQKIAVSNSSRMTPTGVEPLGRQPAALDQLSVLELGSATTTVTANGSGRPLTRREREIAELLARGMTNASIAAQLGIARRTVDTHVSRLLRKLGVSSRVDVERALLAPTQLTPTYT